MSEFIPPPPNPNRPEPRLSRVPRTFDLVLMGTALLWTVASGTIADRAAHGILARLGLYQLQPLLSEFFLIFLIVLGFALLDWIATRGSSVASIIALPRRIGWPREWGLGAAAGWGMAIAAVLPILLTGRLLSELPHGPASVLVPRVVSVVLATLTLALMTLGQELVFRGYPFRRLVQAIGPSWASVVMSFIFALVQLRQNAALNPGTALLVEWAFGLILAMAYLRTHALWLGWGVHFSYRAVTAILLGLPAAGHIEFASIVDSGARGPVWLTGGPFGPDAAFVTFLVMIAAFAVVFRLTRWYAWEYTHAPIVSGGYEVTVAPPKAHVDMERQAAAAPPPLVQILPSTPQGRTVGDEGRE